MTDELVIVDPQQSQHRLAMWCTEDDLPQKRLSGVTDVDQLFAIAAATDLLYVLSGRQFRSGRSIIRPSSITSAYTNQSYLYPYSSMSGYGGAWGFAAGWAWTAPGTGWWQNGQDLSEVVLQGPVQRINRVLLNGVNLGPWPPTNSNYTLYDRRRLILNVSGNGTTANSWPWEQQLQLSPDQPGTALIDYNWGNTVPSAGKFACIELAIELALSLSGSDDSRLPGRVTNIASQGVSLTVGDSLAYIVHELTGITSVDYFLSAYNPGKLRRRAVFLTPDSIQGREMVGYPDS